MRNVQEPTRRDIDRRPLDPGIAQRMRRLAVLGQSQLTLPPRAH